MGNRINWGILGTASIAERSMAPAICNIKSNKLIAVASRSLSKAQNFAEKFDCIGIKPYEKLIARPDINAIYIPLPTGKHYEYVKKCLEAGKHVLVEKSATETYEQALELCSLAENNNCLLVENFLFQFHSQHNYIKELIKSGIIGEIRCFRSSFGFPPFDIENNIRYNSKLGGGALLDAGAYTLKAVDFMLGANFKVVSSFLNYNKTFNVDWYGGGQLEASDQSKFAQVAFGFENYYQCNYEIWGSKGKITSTRAFTAKPGFKPEIILETENGVETIALDDDDQFTNMIIHFNNLIESNNYTVERNNILRQAKLIEEFRSLAN